jgi:hypothetical protein
VRRRPASSAARAAIGRRSRQRRAARMAQRPNAVPMRGKLRCSKWLAHPLGVTTTRSVPSGGPFGVPAAILPRDAARAYVSTVQGVLIHSLPRNAFWLASASSVVTWRATTVTLEGCPPTEREVGPSLKNSEGIGFGAATGHLASSRARQSAGLADCGSGYANAADSGPARATGGCNLRDHIVMRLRNRCRRHSLRRRCNKAKPATAINLIILLLPYQWLVPKDSGAGR